MAYTAGQGYEKKDLQETAELTKYTMRKLGNDEAVTTDTLAKICRALNCTVDDIMEVLPKIKSKSVYRTVALI